MTTEQQAEALRGSMDFLGSAVTTLGSSMSMYLDIAVTQSRPSSIQPNDLEIVIEGALEDMKLALDTAREAIEFATSKSTK